MSVNLLLIVFVLIVVAMIAFILVQKGAGATAGSAFGSGASNTVFGSKGSGNFLTKTTMMLAFLFFSISMFMAVQASKDFTVADTGEVDLGVVGTLDTSDSDVPEMNPVDATDVPEGDVPSIDVKSDDVPVTDQVDDVISKVTDEAESAVAEKADEIKQDATDAIEEKAEEVKDSIKN